MKTLHITNAWHETSGGVATFYRELLAAAEEAGHEIRLVVPGERDDVEAHGRFGRIYTVRSDRAPFNGAYRMLPLRDTLLSSGKVTRIVKHEEPDLVEVCDKLALPYLAGLLRFGWMPGIEFRPVVTGLSCERLDVNMRAYCGGRGFGGAFARKFMKWVYFPLFDHHIAVSAHTAEELFSASRGHAVRRGVWVSPMGVDTGTFSPRWKSAAARKEIAARLGVPEGQRILLYAGRLSPEKNLPLLLETMEELERQPETDCVLAIAGDGIRARWLAEEAARRIPGRVKMLGYVSDRQELARLYANADVFLHPNPNEPFGIAPLEAMASGAPLVAPRSGGLTVYANAGNAWLTGPDGCSFAAAVRDALDGDGRRARIAAALAAAERYAWPETAARYLRLYEEIHARGRGRAPEGGVPPLFWSSAGNRFGREAPQAAEQNIPG